MHGLVLAAARLLALAALSVLLVPPAVAGRALTGRAPRPLVELWQRTACRIVGLQVVVHGAPAARRPTLFVANHVSYLDITVLGSLVDAAFVAKQEVAGWPVIGFFARLLRTEFVRRERRRSEQETRRLADRLTAGENLILFAEGTSSDGAHVLPFKSAMFGAVAGADGLSLTVQPVTIAYTRLRNGLPIVHGLRWLYAWYGDMALVPHLWSVLGRPGAVVQVRFHEPVPAHGFRSRKELARHAERQVALGLAELRAA